MRKNVIPTQAQYEANECRRHCAFIREIEAAPLAERKEAQADWSDAITHNPGMIAEQVGWLLHGSYGFWPAKLAARIKANARCNQAAQIACLLDAEDHSCPPEMAQAAFKALTPAAQKSLNTAILRELRETDACVGI